MDSTIIHKDLPDRLLNPLEVAEILNISLGFTYRLMRNGKIRTVTMEGARRVRPEDLELYIESCLIPPMHEFISE